MAKCDCSDQLITSILYILISCFKEQITERMLVWGGGGGGRSRRGGQSGPSRCEDLFSPCLFSQFSRILWPLSPLGNLVKCFHISASTRSPLSWITSAPLPLPLIFLGVAAPCTFQSFNPGKAAYELISNRVWQMARG